MRQNCRGSCTHKMHGFIDNEGIVKQIGSWRDNYGSSGRRKGIHCCLKRFCSISIIIGHDTVWRACDVYSFGGFLPTTLPSVVICYRNGLSYEITYRAIYVGSSIYKKPTKNYEAE